MTDPDVLKRSGERLRRIRMRLGLSLREVQRRSLKIVSGRGNPEFHVSRAWLTDIEMGRFVPGSFRVASLSEIYGLTIAQIEKFYGIQPEDISKERPVFRPPKTQLLTPPEENTRNKERLAATQGAENEGLATRLLDVWGEVPAPMMRFLALGTSLFGYIGAADWTMWPLLPPGTFVQIDPKQTRVQKEKGPLQKDAGQSQFARPIYFLDIRTGYACGWCEIKNGVLTLVPHPNSGQPTRTFRYPHEAEVVGRVTGVTMGITEKNFMPIEEQARRNEPKK
jgi:transcriptional regulator with XRE-family HTH domain